MIALAAPSRTEGAASVRRIQLLGIGALVFGLIADPASAQVAASVGVDSDYQLRGYSLTNDRPALSTQIGYDHPSGVYFSLSGLTELGSAPRFLGVIGDAGIAKRLSQDVTIDAGVLRSEIRAAAPDLPGFKYTEIYAGAFVGPISGRIYYSPDYRTERQSTLYGEIEAGFQPVRNWRVSGHVGLLTCLGTSARSRAGGRHADWRISIARQLGNFEIHANLSSKTNEQYERYRSRTKPSLTLGASFSF